METGALEVGMIYRIKEFQTIIADGSVVVDAVGIARGGVVLWLEAQNNILPKANIRILIHLVSFN